MKRVHRRVALHHMITAGNRGYGAWRDGGFTVHDLSDPAKPKLISHINWCPPFPGGTHTPLPLPGRKLAVVADEANAENCAKGLFHTFVVDLRSEENPVPIATLPTPKERDFCGFGKTENLSMDEIIPEKYRGIRPAPGYPACPDHTEKRKLFGMLDATTHTGVILTESLAMYPASSVSGWYFAHPESKYFGVGKIEKDQVEDYAARKGMPLEEVERWLRPVLEYDV